MEHLRTCGVAHVLLEPGFNMANLLTAADGVRQAGAIFLPAEEARIAMIDPRDVAEVAAAVLTSDELTGLEAVTFDDVARELTTVLGRPIGFVPVSDEAALAQAVGAGAPEWFATNLVTVFRHLRRGAQAEVGDVVLVLTGREPRSIADFLQTHIGSCGRKLRDDTAGCGRALAGAGRGGLLLGSRVIAAGFVILGVVLVFQGSQKRATYRKRYRAAEPKPPDPSMDGYLRDRRI